MEDLRASKSHVNGQIRRKLELIEAFMDVLSIRKSVENMIKNEVAIIRTTFCKSMST